jgi:hypothetical protein
MGDVVKMTPSTQTRFDPNDSLRSALKDNLDYVLIMARDKDGDLRVYSNDADMLEASFMAQKLIFLIHEGAFDEDAE